MKTHRFASAAAAVLFAVSALAAESTLPSRPPLTPAQIDAVVAARDRTADDRKNDERRKPAEMLAFIGVRPDMKVLDLAAGGGYTTELLARSVGGGGHVWAQSPPAPAAAASSAMKTDAAASMPAPAAPTSRSAVAIGKRVQATSLANITTVVQPFDAPVPAAVAAGGLDLVTLMFNYHDLEWMKVDRAKMNRAVFAALKPGGAYVIADHAGRAGTGVSESNTLHRIDEDTVRKEVLAAGFAMSAEGNFLRNPADPRDRETPEGGAKKDEFVLKFIKP